MQRQYHLSKMADVTSATQPIDVVRVRGGVRSAANDQAAAEEPLEVRLHGRPFATLMRTPGADRELARAGDARRAVTSACGVCGRATIESLTADVPPIAGALSMAASIVAVPP